MTEHSIHTLKLNPRVPGQCSTSTVGVESTQTIPTTKMVQSLCAIRPRCALPAAGSANKCYKITCKKHWAQSLGRSSRYSSSRLFVGDFNARFGATRLSCQEKKRKKKRRKKTPKQNKKTASTPKLTSLVNCVRRADQSFQSRGLEPDRHPDHHRRPFARRASVHHAHLLKHSSDSIILASFRNVQ